MEISIYILINPLTNEVFYVGQTSNVKERYKKHRNAVIRKNKNGKYLPNKCISYIRNLKINKLIPIFEVIDIVGDDWDFWEQHYISLYKSFGFDLKNGTIGGEGSKGRIPWNKGLTGGSNKNCWKSVDQLDLFGNFIRKFDSIKEAAHFSKCGDANIVNCCKDTRYKKSIGGYKWRYSK